MNDFFDNIEQQIKQNVARAEQEEKSNPQHSPQNPPFLANAVKERQREVEQHQKLLNEQQAVLARQITDMNIPNITPDNVEQFMRSGGIGSMHGASPNNPMNRGSSNGIGAGGIPAIPGQNHAMSPAELQKAKERAEKAPTKLLHPKIMKTLAADIKTQVFGQDLVVDEMVSVLSVACLNIRINKNKPAGCYFLAGPSGCGKTEISRSLAKFLGEKGKEIPFLKIDMGEYGMENDVTKLIGPPPGYSGSEKGGVLTNFVLENPISIILFDEMEKAHESMDKIFLSILDNGVCTDGKGSKVEFRNTIILVTSNLGADIEYYHHYTEEQKHEYRMQAVYETLRPEIVNRFDVIFQCKALPQDVYAKVLVKFIEQLKANIKEEHDVNLSYTQELIDWAAKVSYDPAMGGRPARKFIETVLIKPLADSMINEDVDFTVNKDLQIDLNEDKNVGFKDINTSKFLGVLTTTKQIVENLQKNKFVKGGKQEPQFNEEQVADALAQMSHDTTAQQEAIDVPQFITKSDNLKPAKANRKSSRNDFARS